MGPGPSPQPLTDAGKQNGIREIHLGARDASSKRNYFFSDKNMYEDFGVVISQLHLAV